MTTHTLVRFGCLASSFLLFAGCAGQQQTTETKPVTPFSISCIAVMPVVAAADDEDLTVQQEGMSSLLKGSQVFNALLREELAGKKVQFVAEQDVDMGSPSLEKARAVAGQYQCNTVLDLTVSRYEDRIGGDYGVKQPAAVTFAYRLYETGEGRVLCHGRFDERQQSVMENLFTLSKAKSRGLIWLSAEELARDGLREKFGECSYLGTEPGNRR